jgi:hypothetical protein
VDIKPGNRRPGFTDDGKPAAGLHLQNDMAESGAQQGFPGIAARICCQCRIGIFREMLDASGLQPDLAALKRDK